MKKKYRFSTSAELTALTPREAPYWHKLSNGQHLGVCRTKTNTYWFARANDRAGKQPRHALGDFANLDLKDRFDAASKAARAWFNHLDRGGSVEVVTVREACVMYVEHIRAERGEAAANDVAGRFRRYVDDETIARIALPKLTREHVTRWRRKLAATPRLAQGLRAKTPKPRSATATTPRTAGSVNRDITPLRAALNLAKLEGYVTTDMAWAAPLQPAKNADGRRDVVLTKDERRALLVHIADEHLRTFVSALCALPMRPGALAGLTVADFNPRQGTLRISADKAGAGRTIALPGSAITIMKGAAQNKFPTMPLFAQRNGKPWRVDDWKKPFKAAAAAAKLPGKAVLYSLRHTAITDLVLARVDLFTVATMAGTSVVMIQKHYAHLNADATRDALAGLAL